MEDFYELIEMLRQAKQDTSYAFVIAPRSNIASGAVAFSLRLKGGIIYDMTNPREAIGFLEGFVAYKLLEDTK